MRKVAVLQHDIDRWTTHDPMSCLDSSDSHRQPRGRPADHSLIPLHRSRIIRHGHARAATADRSPSSSRSCPTAPAITLVGALLVEINDEMIAAARRELAAEIDGIKTDPIAATHNTRPRSNKGIARTPLPLPGTPSDHI